jgi:hypothetical protein
MEAELRSHLTALAEAYSAARGIEMVTVARLATGDWRFFDRVEGGASFTARKYDAIICWFAANWPDSAAWPNDVPRPAARGAAA